MKRQLLILMLSVFFLGNAFSQTQIIWTDSMITGQTATSTQMAGWSAFTALLTPRTYTKVIMKGTFDGVGRSCSDSTIVTALANSLNTNTDYISPTACNGHVWHNCASHGYQGEVWLDPPFSCSGANCPGPNDYLIRPNIGNYNWGGVNTNTCSAPSQRMTLIFEYGNITSAPGIEPLADLNVYPNPFSNSFTIAMNNVFSGELTVSNLLGQVIETKHILAGNTAIDTEKLPKGLYFVSVKTSGGTVTKKMIKE